MEEEIKRGRGKIRLGAVVVLAVAVGVGAWLLLRDNVGSSGVPASGPKIVSANELRGLAGSVGHPVYWADRQPNTRLELTKTKNGNIYIRYLGLKDQIGDTHPKFLTVGTYPVENAFGALTGVSKRNGAVVEHSSAGALVVTTKALPTSVYIAYPRSGLQIEVFDPSPKRALELAVSGKIRPVK